MTHITVPQRLPAAKYAEQVTPHGSSQRPPIQVEGFTPAAHRNLIDLPADDQAKTANLLWQPILAQHCELVTSLAAMRVFHCRVPATPAGVRVCIRNQFGSWYVVHVGNHRQFERFANSYSGAHFSSFLRLEDSPIMIKHLQNQQPRTASQSPAKREPSEATNVVDSLSLFSQALVKSISALKDECKQFTAAEIARADQRILSLAQEQQAFGKKIAQQDSSIGTFKQASKRQLDEMHARLSELVQEDAATRAALDSAVAREQTFEASMHEALASLQCSTAEQIEPLALRLDNLVEQVAAEFAAQQAAVDRTRAEWNARLKDFTSTSNTLFNDRLKELARHIDARVHRLEDRVRDAEAAVVNIVATAEKQFECLKQGITDTNKELRAQAQRLESLEKDHGFRGIWNCVRSGWQTLLSKTRKPFRAALWFLLCVVMVLVPSSASGADASMASECVLCLDVSKSMEENGKLAALIETLKIAFTVWNGKVRVLTFADSVVVEGPYTLPTHAARRAAMSHFSSLRTRDGTNYTGAIAALEKLRLPKGTTVVFISDGEPTTGGQGDAIRAAVERSGLRFCTVAVAASPKATALLSEMASVSGGTALAAETAEELTKHFISMAFDLADYMVFHPRIPSEEFRGTFGGGSILAFGFDATTSVEGPSRGDARLVVTAALPGEHVSVCRIELQDTTDVVIRIVDRRSNSARFGKLLRNDVRRYRIHSADVPDNGVEAGRALEIHLDPEPPVRDSTGAIIPQREPEEAVRIVDVESGAVVAEEYAKPNDKGRLSATVQVPPVLNHQYRLEQLETLDDPAGNGQWIRGTRSKTFTTVAPETRGLAKANFDLGSFFSGEGKVGPIHLKFSALDDAEIEYQITAQDLSGDSDVIPLTLSSRTIRPTLATSAEVEATPEIGNVAPGEYIGLVIAKSPLVREPQKFQARLLVSPFLSAQALNPVALQRGMGAIAKVQLSNASSRPAGTIEFQGGRLAVKGGFIEVVPPKSVSMGLGKQQVDIRVMVSADATDQGSFRVPLRVRKGSVDLLVVPIEVQIGEGTGFIVAPSSVKIRGATNEERIFRIRVTATDTSIVPDHIQAIVTQESSRSPSIPIPISLKVTSSPRLTSGRAVQIEGKVLLPEEPGDYLTQILIGSDQNGTVLVPIRITVESLLP